MMRMTKLSVALIGASLVFGVANAEDNSGLVSNTYVGNPEIDGGATNVAAGVVIESLNQDFVGYTSTHYGGAIYNDGTIKSITGDFIGNYAEFGGGAIYNTGEVGILAKDRSVEITGNHAGKDDTHSFWSIHNVAEDTGYSIVQMNSYGANKIVVNDGITGAVVRREHQIVNVNSGLDGGGFSIDTAGESFGVVEFNNKVINNTVNVLGGTLRAGSHKGGPISIGSGKTVTTEDSTAHFANSVVNVVDDAKLLIGAGVDGKTAVWFNSESVLDLKSGSTLAFEKDASIDFDGTFLANDATLSLEFGDYVAGLKEGETVELDWVIGTFVDPNAAADALAGFSNFENDLGIAKGDGSTGEPWFNVTQEGTELKVTGVIPEPATIGLFGLIGGALMAVRRSASVRKRL